MPKEGPNEDAWTFFDMYTNPMVSQYAKSDKAT